MKRILQFLLGCSAAIWQSALAPIVFGLAGALLLDFICQSLLLVYDSVFGAHLGGSSTLSLNLSFVDVLVGFIGGLAIWHWKESRSS